MLPDELASATLGPGGSLLGATGGRFVRQRRPVSARSSSSRLRPERFPRPQAVAGAFPGPTELQGDALFQVSIRALAIFPSTSTPIVDIVLDAALLPIAVRPQSATVRDERLARSSGRFAEGQTLHLGCPLEIACGDGIIPVGCGGVSRHRTSGADQDEQR
jgi:hypothetical protein